MRRFMSKYNKDHYGGGLMLLLGVGILLQGATYQVGTLSHMGPGFFPVALGAILALVGVAIFFTAEKIGSARRRRTAAARMARLDPHRVEHDRFHRSRDLWRAGAGHLRGRVHFRTGRP